MNDEGSFNPEKSLHRRVFTHRNLYTEKFLDTEAFTQRSLYTKEFLHTNAFTQRSVQTQKLLQTKLFHNLFDLNAFAAAGADGNAQQKKP